MDYLRDIYRQTNGRITDRQTRVITYELYEENRVQKWEDSTLSMHSQTIHKENFSLKNFMIFLIKKCSQHNIRREQLKCIDKL